MVVVVLRHRDELGEKEQLRAEVVVEESEADRSNDEARPLLGRELAPSHYVALEVKASELDGADFPVWPSVSEGDAAH